MGARGGDWAGPSTASVPTSSYSMWHCNCLWSLGLMCDILPIELFIVPCILPKSTSEANIFGHQWGGCSQPAGVKPPQAPGKPNTDVKQYQLLMRLPWYTIRDTSPSFICLSVRCPFRGHISKTKQDRLSYYGTLTGSWHQWFCCNIHILQQIPSRITLKLISVKWSNIPRTMANKYK